MNYEFLNQPVILDLCHSSVYLFRGYVLTSYNLNVQYLPIEGLAAFNKVTAELLFGADNPVIKEKRVCTS